MMNIREKTQAGTPAQIADFVLPGREPDCFVDTEKAVIPGNGESAGSDTPFHPVPQRIHRLAASLLVDMNLNLALMAMPAMP